MKAKFNPIIRHLNRPMYSHQYFAVKLRKLFDSIEDWALATPLQRARAEYLSAMIKLAHRRGKDE